MDNLKTAMKMFFSDRGEEDPLSAFIEEIAMENLENMSSQREFNGPIDIRPTFEQISEERVNELLHRDLILMKTIEGVLYDRAQSVAAYTQYAPKQQRSLEGLVNSRSTLGAALERMLEFIDQENAQMKQNQTFADFKKEIRDVRQNMKFKLSEYQRDVANAEKEVTNAEKRVAKSAEAFEKSWDVKIRNSSIDLEGRSSFHSRTNSFSGNNNNNNNGGGGGSSFYNRTMSNSSLASTSTNSNNSSSSNNNNNNNQQPHRGRSNSKYDNSHNNNSHSNNSHFISKDIEEAVSKAENDLQEDLRSLLRCINVHDQVLCGYRRAQQKLDNNSKTILTTTMHKLVSREKQSLLLKQQALERLEQSLLLVHLENDNEEFVADHMYNDANNALVLLSQALTILNDVPVVKQLQLQQQQQQQQQQQGSGKKLSTSSRSVSKSALTAIREDHNNSNNNNNNNNGPRTPIPHQQSSSSSSASKPINNNHHHNNNNNNNNSNSGLSGSFMSGGGSSWSSLMQMSSYFSPYTSNNNNNNNNNSSSYNNNNNNNKQDTFRADNSKSDHNNNNNNNNNNYRFTTPTIPEHSELPPSARFSKRLEEELNSIVFSRQQQQQRHQSKQQLLPSQQQQQQLLEEENEDDTDEDEEDDDEDDDDSVENITDGNNNNNKSNNNNNNKRYGHHFGHHKKRSPSKAKGRTTTTTTTMMKTPTNITEEILHQTRYFIEATLNYLFYGTTTTTKQQPSDIMVTTTEITDAVNKLKPFCDTALGRQDLLFELNQFRSKRCQVNRVGYDGLTLLLLHCLDHCEQEFDVHTGKLIMILSQTFYRVDDPVVVANNIDAVFDAPTQTMVTPAKGKSLTVATTTTTTTATKEPLFESSPTPSPMFHSKKNTDHDDDNNNNNNNNNSDSKDSRSNKKKETTTSTSTAATASLSLVEERQRRVFLRDGLRDHPLWRQQRFWEQALWECVLDQMETVPNEVAWYLLDRDERVVIVRRIHNIIFSQVMAIIHSMLELEVGLSLTREFLFRVCTVHQLSEQHRQQLLHHLNTFYLHSQHEQQQREKEERAKKEEKEKSKEKDNEKKKQKDR